MPTDFTSISNFNRDSNFASVRFGASSPVLEVELNELQDIQNESRADIIRDSIPSGFIQLGDIDYLTMSTNPNLVKLINRDSMAYVNGYKIFIPAGTIINLDAPPVDVPREDLVFLEVWKEEVDYTKSIGMYGKAETASTVPNNIKDNRVGIETSRRIQLKWRLRVVDNVDFSNINLRDGFVTQAYVSGMSWAGMIGKIFPTAQGANASPLVFSATDATNQCKVFSEGSHQVLNRRIFNDVGMFIAGDGTDIAKSTLGSVDGYVYAIPMFRIRRRPSCGFQQRDDYERLSPLVIPTFTQRFIDGSRISSSADGAMQATISGRTLVNLLGDAGNCEDISKWGSADLYSVSTTLKLFGSGSLRGAFTGSGSWIQKDVYGLDATHKYMLSGYMYITSYTSGQLSLNYSDAGAWTNLINTLFNTSTLSQWQRKSLVFSGRSAIKAFVGVPAGSTATVNVDGMMLYDLTAIYGAGNEPSDIAQLERELPFVGSVASSKPVALKVKGQNLFDNSVTPNYTQGYAVASPLPTGIKVRNVANVTYNYVQYSVRLKPNVQYTLSRIATKIIGTTGGTTSVYKLTDDGVFNTQLASIPGGSNSPVSFYAPDNGMIAILFYSTIASVEASEVDFTNVVLSEGSTATYTDHKASQVILPSIFTDMKAVGGVKDTIDLATKRYTKRVSDWVILDGSQSWAYFSSYAGSKVLRGIGALPSNTVTNIGIALKYNSVPLAVSSVDSMVDHIQIGGDVLTQIYINAPNTDTGWVDSYTPSVADIRAYFYGWKMCKSDGSAWDGVATKYWKKITDSTGITSTCPNASYAGYTPYRVIYQLATPIDIDITELLQGALYVNGGNETHTLETSQVGSTRVFPTGIANAILNSDFGSGTTNWVADNSTITASNNILTITGDGTDSAPRAHQSTGIGAVQGRKVYYRALCSVTNPSSSYSSVFITDGIGTPVTDSIIAQNNPAQNVVYPISGLATVQAGLTGNIRMYMRHNYADSATASGKSMQVQQVLMLDLTSIFSYGNEPSKEWCDKYLEFETNYVAKSPVGTTALAVQRNRKDVFRGVQGNMVMIPATKYKNDGSIYEVLYMDAPETHVAPDVTVTIGAQTLNLVRSRVGSIVLADTDVPYKRHSDGSVLYSTSCVVLTPNPSPLMYGDIGSAVVSSAFYNLVKVGDKLYTPSSSYQGQLMFEVVSKLGGNMITVKNIRPNGGSAGGITVVPNLRPDGLLSDIVADRDILDLRHRVSLTGFDYNQMLNETFDKLIRNEL